MKKIEILRIESLSRAPLVLEGNLFEVVDPKAASFAIASSYTHLRAHETKRNL